MAVAALAAPVLV